MARPAYSRWCWWRQNGSRHDVPGFRAAAPDRIQDQGLDRADPEWGCGAGHAEVVRAVAQLLLLSDPPTGAQPGMHGRRRRVLPRADNRASGATAGTRTTRHRPPILSRHAANRRWTAVTLTPGVFTSSHAKTATVAPTIACVIVTASQPQRSGKPAGAPWKGRARRNSTSPGPRTTLDARETLKASPCHAVPAFRRNRRDSGGRLARCASMARRSGAATGTGYHVHGVAEQELW